MGVYPSVVNEVWFDVAVNEFRVSVACGTGSIPMYPDISFPYEFTLPYMVIVPDAMLPEEYENLIALTTVAAFVLPGPYP